MEIWKVLQIHQARSIYRVVLSNRLMPKIKRAANFNIDCRCCKRDQGKRVRTPLQKSTEPKEVQIKQPIYKTAKVGNNGSDKPAIRGWLTLKRAFALYPAVNSLPYPWIDWSTIRVTFVKSHQRLIVYHCANVRL